MFKANRVGLIVVFASLLAIATILVLLFQYQRDQRVSTVHSQGVSLVRLVSGIRYEQLVLGGTQHGAIQMLKHTAGDSGFAYLSIVDSDGLQVAEVTADGGIVPPALLPTEPSAWFGNRELAAGETRYVEFHAPLLDEGELQGFTRLGFFYPAGGVTAGQLPFIAAVALPIFLLAPLFYALLRYEVRPIRMASQHMADIIGGDSFKRVEISANGELRDFMLRLNGLIEHASTKVNVLEQDNVRLITSSKLLNYRKNRVETVLETLPEALAIVDETGAITFANKKLAAMLGVTQEKIISEAPHQWCEHADVLDLFMRLQSSGKKNFTETIRFKSGVSLDKSIATKTYPLFSSTAPSVSLGTLIVFRDETHESLAREARGEFVGHLSHELKSPLNVLSLYSEALLGEQGQSREFRIEAANVITAEVDRMSALITGLLSMTQIESGSLTPDKTHVKIRDVAAAAFETAKSSAADRNIEFKFVAPREMSPVMVDKDLLRIAITNLLSNAVKYNCENGEVILSVEETEDAIQIRVADTGIGIGEEEEAKIFEKFFRSQTDEIQAVEGHGLGLTLTKQIVELHHGTLTLNRERSSGAEFIINLWKDSTDVRQAI